MKKNCTIYHVMLLCVYLLEQLFTLNVFVLLQEKKNGTNVLLFRWFVFFFSGEDCIHVKFYWPRLEKSIYVWETKKKPSKYGFFMPCPWSPLRKVVFWRKYRYIFRKLVVTAAWWTHYFVLKILNFFRFLESVTKNVLLLKLCIF